MKIDIKMIVIAVLALVIVGFIMFGGKGGVEQKAYEKERAELQSQIDSLEVLKTDADARIGTLEDSYNKMLKDYEKLKVVNDSLNVEIGKLSVEIDNRKKDYYASQKKIKELNKKLEDMKKNPSNREGDELIDNLRNTFN